MPAPRRTPCPSCGAAIDCDPRFVQWCPACDWNVDPSPSATPTWRTRVVDRLQRRLETRLYADVVARGTRPRRTLRLCLTVAAGLVHLVTVALLPGGIVLLVRPTDLAVVVQYAGAVLLLLIGLAVQPATLPSPRQLLRRRRTDPEGLTRQRAPRLFGLFDELATAVGTTPPDRVLVSPAYNASLKVTRRATTIVLGQALWSVLDGPEIVALLGHELAHRVNGDQRRTHWVGGAVVTLHRWAYILRPWPHRRTSRGSGALGGGLAGIGELLVPIALIPLTLAISALATMLNTLASWLGQRSEYYADLLGAEVAGSEAMIRLLDRLTLSRPLTSELERSVQLRRDADPWTALATYAAGIPDTERIRLDRLGALQRHRIDSTHPPSSLRRDAVAARPRTGPVVSVDASRAHDIGEELAPAVAAMTSRLL